MLLAGAGLTVTFATPGWTWAEAAVRKVEPVPAVYFQTFTPAAWAVQGQDYLAAEALRADLARRRVDVFHIGEMQPERDHALAATGGKPGTF